MLGVKNIKKYKKFALPFVSLFAISVFVFTGFFGSDESDKNVLGASDGCSYVDSFGAGLSNGWGWINENQQMRSFSERPGYLRINTESGEIWRGNSDAKNILLRNVFENNFEITTRLEFEPEDKYQQAGLVIYEDTDNYQQLLYGYWEGNAASKTPSIVQNAEVGGKSKNKVSQTSGSADNYVQIEQVGVYLKLKKESNLYTSYFSIDGVNWSEVGSIESTFNASKVGLMAVNGKKKADSKPADFDFFCIKSVNTDTTPPSGEIVFEDSQDGVFVNSSNLTTTFSAVDRKNSSSAANKVVAGKFYKGADAVYFGLDKCDKMTCPVDNSFEIWDGSPLVLNDSVAGDGLYARSVEVVDLSGNKGLLEKSIIKDTSKPVIDNLTISDSENTDSLENRINFEINDEGVRLALENSLVTSSQNMFETSYSFDGVNFVSLQDSFLGENEFLTTFLDIGDSGELKVYIKTVDKAGNESQVYSDTINYERPQQEILDPDDTSDEEEQTVGENESEDGGQISDNQENDTDQEVVEQDPSENNDANADANQDDDTQTIDTGDEDSSDNNNESEETANDSTENSDGSTNDDSSDNQEPNTNEDQIFDEEQEEGDNLTSQSNDTDNVTENEEVVNDNNAGDTSTSDSNVEDNSSNTSNSTTDPATSNNSRSGTQINLPAPTNIQNDLSNNQKNENVQNEAITKTFDPKQEEPEVLFVGKYDKIAFADDGKERVIIVEDSKDVYEVSKGMLFWLYAIFFALLVAEGVHIYRIMYKNTYKKR